MVSVAKISDYLTCNKVQLVTSKSSLSGLSQISCLGDLFAFIFPVGCLLAAWLKKHGQSTNACL